jgi:P4 family phage/plasmid primase-like protien
MPQRKKRTAAPPGEEAAASKDTGMHDPREVDDTDAVQSKARFSQLAQFGLSVFPIPAGRKRPANKWSEWQQRRASPPELALWDQGQSNIGIVTGTVSGVDVLDFDNLETFELAKKRGLIGETWMARTPRGVHVYFRHQPGIRNSAGKVEGLEGLDVRGEGGFVVAPGSTFEPDDAELAEGKVAGSYCWLYGFSPADVELAELPAPWRELLAKRRRQNRHSREPSGPSGDNVLDGAIRRVREAAQGERNETLNRETFFLAQRAESGGWDHEDVVSRLAEAAAAIGLEPDEVDYVLDHAWPEGLDDPRDIDGDDLPPSEHAVALEFTRQHRREFLFDHDSGAWHRWDNACWRQENTGLAFEHCRRIAAGFGGGRSMQKASTAAGAERFARSDRAHAVDSSRWDQDPLLLATPAGPTIDLRTGSMRAARPEDYITKVAGFVPQPGVPALWLRCLSEWTGGDAEVIRFIQQFTGYCLTGLTVEHALLFIFGSGGNGKSVFLNMLLAALGEYGMTAGMETFAASKSDRHTTELARLRGARLVAASEIEEGRAFNAARVKQATGGDPITARFMRQNDFTYRPQFKLIFTANDQPRLHQVDDAMRRRINMLPFLLKPAKPDTELEAKLKAEGGRILMWMVEGCLDWQRNGLIRPEAVKLATDDYFDGQDVFGQWIEERCLVGPNRAERPSTLYANWVQYARHVGEEPGTQTAFSQRLSKRFQRRKSNGQRLFIEIALAPQAGEPM